jgi:hypothetical protein
VGGVLPIDSETLFVTDFVNVKMKLAQCFGGAHRSRVYVRVFIGVRAHTCMSICVCTVFFKKHCSKKDDKTVVLFLRFSFLSFFLFFNNTGVDHTWIKSRSVLGTVAHSTGVTDLFSRGSGVEDLLHLS